MLFRSFKVNPPLRTWADVQALRSALADGTIDIVATDHAPHPLESKECEWNEAANGMIGLESALSVIQESVVDSKLMSWETVAERMSIVPAQIARLKLHGKKFEIGAPANLLLYDSAVRRKVSDISSASKSRNNPYRDMSLPGQVRFTILNGHLTVANGELVQPL